MSRPELTERQAQVAEGLVRHLTLKEIAAELDVSPSAVNKHIAALKSMYGARSRAEIVAAFSATHSGAGVSKASGSFSHLPANADEPPRLAPDDPGVLRFADGADYPFATDVRSAIEWPGLDEPRVVPRWLDGRNAVSARLATVFGGIFAVFATLVLSITSLKTTSELVGGSSPDLELQRRSAA